jgi:hypothetical protein
MDRWRDPVSNDMLFLLGWTFDSGQILCVFFLQVAVATDVTGAREMRAKIGVANQLLYYNEGLATALSRNPRNSLHMFGNKGVYTLEKRSDNEERHPSPFLDKLVLAAVSFAFGVVCWYLIRPLIGM